MVAQKDSLRSGLAEYLYEILPEVKQDIRNRNSKPELPISIESINDLTFGFPRGKITTISGRPGHGKTGFMLQEAWQLASQGKNVIFITLEDNRRMCVERIMCQMTQVDNRRLLEGDTGKINFVKLHDTFSKMNMVIEDKTGFNLREIDLAYNVIKFGDAMKSADIIFFDYLQMIDGAGLEGYTKFMKDLKIWVLENNVAFVMGCQQNRWSVSKDGSVSNAGTKGSGTIEEVSDLILLVYYPFNVNDEKGHWQNDPDLNSLNPAQTLTVWKHYLEISVSKNKIGPVFHKIPVFYRGSTYTFRKWPRIASICFLSDGGFWKIEEETTSEVEI